MSFSEQKSSDDALRFAILALEELSKAENTLAPYIDALQFTGFDPLRIRNAMVRIAGDDRICAKEASQLILIFVMRGTKIDKIKKKSSDKKWASLYDGLIRKYNIKDVPNPGPDTITLGRLANSFPEITAKVLRQADTRFTDLTTTLPKELCFPGGASLIPRGEDSLIREHKRYTDMLKAKLVPTGAVVKTSNVDYWEITHQSSLFSDDYRYRLLNELLPAEVYKRLNGPEDEESGDDTFASPLKDIADLDQTVVETKEAPKRTKSKAGFTPTKTGSHKRKADETAGSSKAGASPKMPKRQ